jgi:hypothetical protein
MLHRTSKAHLTKPTKKALVELGSGMCPPPLFLSILLHSTIYGSYVVVVAVFQCWKTSEGGVCSNCSTGGLLQLIDNVSHPNYALIRLEGNVSFLVYCINTFSSLIF